MLCYKFWWAHPWLLQQDICASFGTQPPVRLLFPMPKPDGYGFHSLLFPSIRTSTFSIVNLLCPFLPPVSYLWPLIIDAGHPPTFSGFTVRFSLIIMLFLRHLFVLSYCTYSFLIHISFCFLLSWRSHQIMGCSNRRGTWSSITAHSALSLRFFFVGSAGRPCVSYVSLVFILAFGLRFPRIEVNIISSDRGRSKINHLNVLKKIRLGLPELEGLTEIIMISNRTGLRIYVECLRILKIM